MRKPKNTSKKKPQNECGLQGHGAGSVKQKQGTCLSTYLPAIFAKNLKNTPGFVFC
jgi:hypothetical protein